MVLSLKLSVFSYCVLVAVSGSGEDPSGAHYKPTLVGIILIVVKESGDFVLLFSPLLRGLRSVSRGEALGGMMCGTGYCHCSGRIALLGRYVLKVAAEHVPNR